MNSLNRFIVEWTDDRIAELQRLIDIQPPYQPQPGDADYLTVEQVQSLRFDAELPIE